MLNTNEEELSIDNSQLQQEALIGSILSISNARTQVESSNRPGAEEFERCLLVNSPLLTSIVGDDLRGRSILKDNIRSNVEGLPPDLVDLTINQINDTLRLINSIPSYDAMRRIQGLVPIQLPSTRSGLSAGKVIAKETIFSNDVQSNELRVGMINLEKALRILDKLFVDKARSSGDLLVLVKDKAQLIARSRLPFLFSRQDGELEKITNTIVEEKINMMQRELVTCSDGTLRTSYDISLDEIIEQEDLVSEVDQLKSEKELNSDVIKETVTNAVVKRRVLSFLIESIQSDKLVCSAVSKLNRMNEEQLLSLDNSSKLRIAEGLLKKTTILLSIEERRVLNIQNIILSQRQRLDQDLQDPENQLSEKEKVLLSPILNGSTEKRNRKALIDLAKSRLKERLNLEVTDEEILLILSDRIVRELLVKLSGICINQSVQSLVPINPTLQINPSKLLEMNEQIIDNALNNIPNQIQEIDEGKVDGDLNNQNGEESRDSISGTPLIDKFIQELEGSLEFRDKIMHLLDAKDLQTLQNLGFPSELYGLMELMNDRGPDILISTSHAEELDLYKLISLLNLQLTLPCIGKNGNNLTRIRSDYLDTVGLSSSVISPFKIGSIGVDDDLFGIKNLTGESILSAQDLRDIEDRLRIKTDLIVESIMSQLNPNISQAIRSKTLSIDIGNQKQLKQQISINLITRMNDLIDIVGRVKNSSISPISVSKFLMLFEKQLNSKILGIENSLSVEESLGISSDLLSDDKEYLDTIKKGISLLTESYGVKFPKIISIGGLAILEINGVKGLLSKKSEGRFVFNSIYGKQEEIDESEIGDLLANSIIPLAKLETVCLIGGGITIQMGSEYGIRDEIISRLGVSGMAKEYLSRLRIGNDKQQGNEGIILRGTNNYIPLTLAYVILGKNKLQNLINRKIGRTSKPDEFYNHELKKLFSEELVDEILI